MKEIGALFVESSEIGSNGAEGIETRLGTEAAGDLLFDLGHAHRLLGDVVGERDVVIGREAPDIVGMDAQAVDEIDRLALFGSAAFAGHRCTRVGSNIIKGNPSPVFGTSGNTILLCHHPKPDSLDLSQV